MKDSPTISAPCWLPAAACGHPTNTMSTWRRSQPCFARDVPGARGAHCFISPSESPARGWLNWRRGTDYYDEGDLVWLEVATIIHRETKGQKSIDDFCHNFHGGSN